MSDAPNKTIRSPSYPSMSLREAVQAVGKIERQYRSSPVDRGLAAKLIGYSSLSGPASKALAALASYGLLERAGKGEARVTPRARAILHAEYEQERQSNLLDAAAEPDLFRELQERFDGISIPPEEGVVTYLNRRGFNPTAVKPATKAFLETMDFLQEIGATKSHGVQTENQINSENPDISERDRFGGAEVGDYIQWESQGVLQLKQPQRVRAISDDGDWLFIDGSTTGIPMNEVVVVQAGVSASSSVRQPPEMPLQPIVENETAIQAGEIEWMRNKVGSDSTIRILVKGEMGPKEIGKLIRILEAQKLVLEDE